MDINITGRSGEDILRKLSDIEYYREAGNKDPKQIWLWLTTTVLKEKAKILYMTQYKQQKTIVDTYDKLLPWLYDKLNGELVVDARKQAWKRIGQGYNEPPRTYYTRYDAAVKEYTFAINVASVYEAVRENNRYFKIPTKEKLYQHRHKTAFAAPDGLWDWASMSFGFMNAPGTFQRGMDSIFGDIKGVIIYLDDILICAETEEEMLNILMEIFLRLRKNKIKATKLKSKFFMKQLKYLGHIISYEGTKPDPEYVNRVIKLKEPENVPEVNRLDGMINWLAKYIPHLSHKMEPINMLRRKGQPWIWGKAQINAFMNIKEAVKNAKILKHPNINKPFYVICDASDYATGAVLLQEYEGIYYPVEFYSHLLDQNQRHWHISEKEILSVVLALEKWQKYLLGVHFHVYTDHRNLIQLLNYENENKLAKSKLIRWILRLQEFDFTAHYITGAENIADYFSRDILFPNKISKVIDKTKEEIFIMKGPTKYISYSISTDKHYLYNFWTVLLMNQNVYGNRNRKNRIKINMVIINNI